MFAEHLRAPTLANEADAASAIAELQAAMGLLAPRQPARDVAAIREHHRRKARAAIDVLSTSSDRDSHE